MKTQKAVSLHLPSLHHAEFGQLIVRFFEDFDQTSLDPAADVDFKLIFDHFRTDIPLYNSALDQVRASEESKKITQLDDERDADFQALKDSVKPYRNTKSETEKSAYEALKILFASYKGVEEDAYEEETNKLNSLTSKLQSSDYSAHVAALGIEKFVIHLSDSNTVFNTLFAQRSYKTSQKEVVNVKNARKKLTEDYIRMVNYIAILSDVKTDTFYKDVLVIINNGRKYFSDVIQRRKGTKSNTPKQ